LSLNFVKVHYSASTKTAQPSQSQTADNNPMPMIREAHSSGMPNSNKQLDGSSAHVHVLLQLNVLKLPKPAGSPPAYKPLKLNTVSKLSTARLTCKLKQTQLKPPASS
jgi:hypothetical protein